MLSILSSLCTALDGNAEIPVLINTIPKSKTPKTECRPELEGSSWFADTQSIDSQCDWECEEETIQLAQEAAAAMVVF